jgi:hypothetical protein
MEESKEDTGLLTHEQIDELKPWNRVSYRPYTKHDPNAKTSPVPNIAIVMFIDGKPYFAYCMGEQLQKLDEQNPNIMGREWCNIERQISEVNVSELRIFVEHASMFAIERINLRDYIKNDLLGQRGPC